MRRSLFVIRKEKVVRRKGKRERRDQKLVIGVGMHENMHRVPVLSHCSIMNYMYIS